ncbi:MAG: hypothetical protein JSW31_06220, partial [Burkholderiales bacterium]
MLRTVALTPRLAALGLAVLASSCGGGGGDSTLPPTPPRTTCDSGAALEVVADTTVSVGRVAGAAILGC